MKKPRRIRYFKNEGHIQTDTMYGYDALYRAWISPANIAFVYKHPNVTEPGELLFKQKCSNQTKAKAYIRKKLIELGCLIGREFKKGITIDSKGRLVVK